MPPVHTKRPASSRDAGPLHLSRTLANRGRYLLYCRFPWITSETALPVADNTFAPMTLPTSLPTSSPTLLPTFVPLAGPLTWSLGLVTWTPLGASISVTSGDDFPIPGRRKPARPLVSSSRVRRTRSGSQSSSSRGSGLPALYVPSRSVSYPLPARSPMLSRLNMERSVPLRGSDKPPASTSPIEILSVPGLDAVMRTGFHNLAFADQD